MSTTNDDTSRPDYLLIARKDGSSSSRRQRRFATLDAVERAIPRWRARGFNTWWILGPTTTNQRPVVREWRDEPVDDRKYPPFRCPQCGAEVQASVTVDADVDETTGVILPATTGGSFRLYCANDHDLIDACDFNGTWPELDATEMAELLAEGERNG